MDTTWTKGDSPHNLTGPVLVNYGVTLTIEAGAIVKFNDYYMLVNGTLVAVGSGTDPIHFNGGNITFTQYSNGWNEQTGSGCIIENVIINQTSLFSGSNSLKINNNTITGEISVGESSVVSNNIITGVITGNSPLISNNNITAGVTYSYDMFGRPHEVYVAINISGSSVLSNNIITGTMSVGGSSVISNNTITGELHAESSVISGNALTGGGTVYDFVGRTMFPRSVLYISGDSVVANNTITSQGGGYGITVETDCDAYIADNIISGFVMGIDAAGKATIERNLILDNGGGIAIGKIPFSYSPIVIGEGEIIIRDNTIENSSVGIGGPVVNTNTGISVDAVFTSTATIERNLIINNTVEIELSSQVTIYNNTITNSSVAIKLGSGLSTAIKYNNIENYGENSIYLEGSSSNIDATYNWWGTTDTQAINMTIHDYKYDFDLGKVTFVPFLTEPNPEAMPISEFSSWIILPIFITATISALIIKKSYFIHLHKNNIFV